MRTFTLPVVARSPCSRRYCRRNCCPNWLITLTAPRLSTFWLAPLVVFPLVLMHLGMLFGRLSATCALSTGILASWTRIWLPKSPRAALRARSLPLLFSPSLAARAAGSQEWSTRNWRLLWALLCAFRSPSHLIRPTGNSVAIYSSGWSFYNRGMSSIFFSRIPPICSFRDDVPPRIPMEPTVLCRPPLFQQWSAFVSWSQRTFGGSLTSLTSRVPVRQSCRRSNHQLWFRAGSFVRASDAPPWSRRLPIPVPISARHVHSGPRAATGPLSRSHGQGFHGFSPTSDPSPTRVPPALVSALLTVHWSRSV